MADYSVILHDENLLKSTITANLGRIPISGDGYMPRAKMIVGDNFDSRGRLQVDPYRIPIESMLENDIDSSLMISYYRLPWQRHAIDCVNIPLASKRAELEPVFIYQAQYLDAYEHLTSEPISSDLSPSGYQYDLSCLFPCRDTVLYRENVHQIGINLLSTSFIGMLTEETSTDVLVRKIDSTKTEYYSDIWDSLQNTQHRDRTKRQVLLRAWEIASHCHNLKIRVPDSRLDSRLNEASVALGKAYCQKIGQFIKASKESRPNDNGPAIAAWLLSEYLRRSINTNLHGQPALEEVEFAAGLLACSAVCNYERLLYQIHDDSSGKTIDDKAWEMHPLAAFLATSILLADIAVRLCWNSPDIDLANARNWGDVAVNCILPVASLSLVSVDGKPTMYYELESGDAIREFTDGNMFDILTDQNTKRNSIRNAFAPEGLRILTQEMAEALEFALGTLHRPFVFSPAQDDNGETTINLIGKCHSLQEQAQKAIDCARKHLSDIKQNDIEIVELGEGTPEAEPYTKGDINDLLAYYGQLSNSDLSLLDYRELKELCNSYLKLIDDANQFASM